MVEIAVLHHDEGIRVNGRRVIELYDELGATAAERVIGRVTEELAVALQRVLITGRGALTGWDTDEGQASRIEAAEKVERLGELAWQVGLASLAHVASDVAGCAVHGDLATFAAILARLERVGNRSLTAVWDAQDLRR